MGYDLHSKTNPPTVAEQDEIRNAVMKDRDGDPRMIMQEWYDALTATGRYFRFASVAWPKALQLAREHGWRPEHEDDYYTRQRGEVVSDADAARLADAIDLASVGLPEPDWSRHPFEKRIDDDTVMYGADAARDLSPADFFSYSPGKLQRFAAFARKGAFTIE